MEPSKKNEIYVSRINSIAKAVNAKNYLEIGVCKGETFVFIDIDTKIAVDPNFLFDTKQFQSNKVLFFNETSDAFFTKLSAAQNVDCDSTSERKFLNVPKTFDVIFIDGLHTYEQVLRDFENSLPYSHEKTVWIIDDTVPCDPYSVYTDQQKVLEWRAQAALEGQEWHGDVYKIVFALHDRYKNFSYCTVFNGNPQTVVWRSSESNRTSLFTPDEINNLDYFSLLRHSDVLMPVVEENLLDVIGLSLAPLQCSDPEAWKKIVRPLKFSVVNSVEYKKSCSLFQFITLVFIARERMLPWIKGTVFGATLKKIIKILEPSQNNSGGIIFKFCSYFRRNKFLAWLFRHF